MDKNNKTDTEAKWEDIDFSMDATNDVNLPEDNISIDDLFSDEKDVILPEQQKIKSFDTDSFSALKLFDLPFPELPKLIDPIFPKVGLASLVGSSDTGKSTFLRQLALSLALGLDDFVGYKLFPTSRNVIFISTEDDPASTSVSIKKPISKILQNTSTDKKFLNHLKFIFDVDVNPESPKNIIKVLEKDLQKTDVDLIVVDAFTDIFSGDINSSTKVREFLNQFSKIAKTYNCLVLFLHHTGKRTDKYTASKDNVLGSQAFEAKMRVVIELKQYPNDETLRTLTITKGNYISSQIKKYSNVLKFDEEHLLFSFERQILSDSISSLAKTNPKKVNMIPIIKSLHKEGKSGYKILEELKNKGFKVEKSTVYDYIKEIKNAEKTTNIIEKEIENIDFSIENDTIKIEDIL